MTIINYDDSYEEVGEEIILTLEITKVAEQDSALYLCEEVLSRIVKFDRTPNYIQFLKTK